MVKIIKRFGPLIIWMAIIFSFSSQPTIQASKFDLVDFIVKKSAHLAEYAILYFLAFRAFSSKNAHQKAFILGLVFAFSDEIHQMFTPGRTAKIRDILIFDLLGLIAGYLVVTKNKLISVWLKK